MRLIAVAALVAWMTLPGSEGFAKSIEFKSLDVVPGFEADKLDIPGKLSKPRGDGKLPAVVLLHTCGGFNRAITRFWPRYLKKLGYVTLAVDSLSPRDLHNCGGSGEKYPRWGTNDAFGALDYLGKLSYVDKQRVAVMGFSAGGMVAAFMVRHNFKTPDGLDFRAAASFYAFCSSRKWQIPRVGEVMIPWAIINGSNDGERLVRGCQRLSDEPNVEHHLLEGAYHAFDVKTHTEVKYEARGLPMLYSKKATKEAQAIIRAFLSKHLGN